MTSCGILSNTLSNETSANDKYRYTIPEDRFYLLLSRTANELIIDIEWCCLYGNHRNEIKLYSSLKIFVKMITVPPFNALPLTAIKEHRCLLTGSVLFLFLCDTTRTIYISSSAGDRRNACNRSRIQQQL